jgi:hypothetical protein
VTVICLRQRWMEERDKGKDKRDEKDKRDLA